MMKSRQSFCLTFDDPTEKLPFTGERYVSGHVGQTQHAHHHRYLFSHQFCAGKTVLDVASGEGYGAALLASTAASVTGVDVDPSTIDFARRNYARDNLSFVAAAAQTLPFRDSSFDVVVSFETIEHLSQHDEFIGEILRVLRPDGMLIISSPERTVYSDRASYNNPYHIKELSLDEFDGLLRANFKNVDLFAQRKICGSYLLPAAPGDRPLDILTTSDGLSYEPGGPFSTPQYLLALASALPLPVAGGGILSNDTFVAQTQQALNYQTRKAAEAAGELARLRAELVAARNPSFRRLVTQFGRKIMRLLPALRRRKDPAKSRSDKQRVDQHARAADPRACDR